MGKLTKILQASFTAATVGAALLSLQHARRDLPGTSLTQEQEKSIQAVQTDRTIEIEPINEAHPTASPSAAQKVEDPEVPSERMPLVILGERNTVIVKGPITDSSVAPIEKELMRKSADLSEKEVIYLVLDTPGGSIDAGNYLIEIIKGLKQKVKTITLFAASMGFHMAQELDERLIIDTGTLMSHRAKASGLAGEVPGSLVVRTNSLLRSITLMEKKASKRMGLSLKDYQDLVRDEYWVGGADAVAKKAADREVLLRCSKDLMGSYVVNIETLFGEAKITFSRCPLVQAPEAIDTSSLKFPDAKTREEFTPFLHEMLFDERGFVDDYVVSEGWHRFLR